MATLNTEGWIAYRYEEDISETRNSIAFIVPAMTVSGVGKDIVSVEVDATGVNVQGMVRNATGVDVFVPQEHRITA